MSSILFGLSKKQLLDYCLTQPFPGTNKWPANHPIWDCFLYGYKSPKEAWSDCSCLNKAIDNLFWILDKAIQSHKYPEFVNEHKKAFGSCILDEEGNIINYNFKLLVLILNRFTIAKIAPKVTALNKNTMYSIMEGSKIDFSKGVYIPMAGFGGIVEASKIWFKNHNIPQQDNSWNYLIEAYDINENFNNYYGWKYRDLLAQHIETNKIVLVCPPFGKNYEHWKGTSNDMSDIDFLEWYFLIHDFINSSNYLIIGPEVNGKNNQKCGLFYKTTGVQLWTDEMWKKEENRLGHKIKKLPW